MGRVETRTDAKPRASRLITLADTVTEALYGPESVEVTVWFDPAAGIIVRAELNRTATSETRHENGQILTSIGTTEIAVELIEQG